MIDKVKKEVDELITEYSLDCSFEEFKYEADWEHISQYQNLSEDFIREFQDEVDWTYIPYYQKLSENFIREFKNKVYWINISRYQNLSEYFIYEFQDRVDIDFLIRTGIITKERLEELKQENGIGSRFEILDL